MSVGVRRRHTRQAGPRSRRAAGRDLSEPPVYARKSEVAQGVVPLSRVITQPPSGAVGYRSTPTQIASRLPVTEPIVSGGCIPGMIMPGTALGSEGFGPNQPWSSGNFACRFSSKLNPRSSVPAKVITGRPRMRCATLSIVARRFVNCGPHSSRCGRRSEAIPGRYRGSRDG